MKSHHILSTGAAIACLVLSLSSAKAEDFLTLELSPEKPYSLSNEAEAQKIFDQAVKWSKESPDIRSIHPSAKHFPGLLKEGYEVVTKDVAVQHKKMPDHLRGINAKLGLSINYNLPNNQTHYSTGLYAPAGEPIEVTVPAEMRGKASVQIGIHTDKIPAKSNWHKEWRRMPLVTNTKALNEEKVTITSPFGGLIYINVDPEMSDINSSVRIAGAVEAVRYVAGKTTREEFATMLANSHAPWGEFETDNLIISMSTEGLRKIKEPEESARVWKDIIGACYDLAQIPEPFFRKQRIVLDEQIWLGLMHSGYPVMAHHREGVQHYEAEQFIYDLSSLSSAWGFFHEIGHNMQNTHDWVFSGTSEVSVNFFSLYIYDQVIMGMDKSHSGVSAAATQNAMKSYFANGAKFEEWKKSPFLGLILFRQIRNEFGWDVYKKIFARFNESSLTGKPCFLPCDSTGDQRKIDNWVYHLSDITKRDLAPFFKVWGIPVSDGVTAVTKQWEPWMPYHFNPKVGK